MRRYLIDDAPARLDAAFVATEAVEDFLPADGARLDPPGWCRIVKLKHFPGLTGGEAAEAMETKLRSMQRTYTDVRLWSYEREESAGAGQSARR
jgi:hypothetical protein